VFTQTLFCIPFCSDKTPLHRRRGPRPPRTSCLLRLHSKMARSELAVEALNVCCAPGRWIRHSASTPWRTLPRSPPPHPGSPCVHFPIVHAACLPIPNQVKIDPCLQVQVQLASDRTRHWRLAHRWIQCLFDLILGFIFTEWSSTWYFFYIQDHLILIYQIIGVSLDTAAILMTGVSLDTFSRFNITSSRFYFSDWSTYHLILDWRLLVASISTI
jgi:hypothetical protein